MTTVIFACIHNAGRSQMAAAWFNALADASQARAISAGTDPGDCVHPIVVEAMREIGIDISGHRSKSVDEFTGQTFDHVITVCDHAAETCPVFPAGHRLHWPFEDPKDLADFRRVRDQMRERIQGWTP